MQKSENALFEEPYEGQFFFEWSSTLLDWSLHLFEWFFTPWSETPLKEWIYHHSFWRAIWGTAWNVKSGVFHSFTFSEYGEKLTEEGEQITNCLGFSTYLRFGCRHPEIILLGSQHVGGHLKSSVTF